MQKMNEYTADGIARFLMEVAVSMYGRTEESEAAGTSDGTPETRGEVKPDFSEDQQNYIDNVILPSRLKRYRVNREQGESISPDERSELERLRASDRMAAEAQADEERRKAEEKGEYQKIIDKNAADWAAKFEAQEAQTQTWRTTAIEKDIDQKLQSAIAIHGDKIVPQAVPWLAMALKSGTPLRGDDPTLYRVTIEDGAGTNYEVALADSDGNRPLNGSAQDVSFAEAVDMILDLNPHFVKANVRPGGGASGNAAAGSTGEQLKSAGERAKTSGRRSDLNEYLKLRAQASRNTPG